LFFYIIFIEKIGRLKFNDEFKLPSLFNITLLRVGSPENVEKYPPTNIFPSD
jgi:hypothetical protein